jgi:signal transduction histidine kinase
VIAIQEVRLLDVLQEITTLLLTKPLQQVHQSLVEKACDLLNIPLSLLWLVEKDELSLQAASDVELVGKRIPLKNSLADQTLQNGQPLSCFEECIDWGKAYPDLAFIHGLGSGLVVPLFSSEDGRAIGAFCIFSSHAELRDFDQSEWFKKVISILGHYAVLAVQNDAHQEALRSVQEQRAVAETFAAVGDIATNLLHSLNNKVGTIPVRVEGIQDKCQPAVDADPYLEKNLAEIERSASEAMQIVRESLFHLHPIQLGPVWVSECVMEATASLTIPEGIQFQTEGLEDLPPVLAGRKRLSMVFLNLFNNAIDAMGSSGLINVSGAKHGDWVEVSVTDSGPGISPELHEKIFEFNYSTHQAERPGKLGFGLWWVKTLLARFGGKISVESDGFFGTTFRIDLPVGDGTA